MIIYNWELAFQLMVGWFFINAIALLLLGVTQTEKSTKYGTVDVFSALTFMALLIIPALV